MIFDAILAVLGKLKVLIIFEDLQGVGGNKK